MTLNYEADDKVVFPFSELVGGAYKLMDCNCGSVICCADISCRLIRGSPDEFDAFFVGNVDENVEESRVDEVDTDPKKSRKRRGRRRRKNDEKMNAGIKNGAICIGLRMTRIHDMNNEYATRFNGDKSGKKLRDFLADKFASEEKPTSEDTLKQMMLGLSCLSIGTLTLREKKLLGRK